MSEPVSRREWLKRAGLAGASIVALPELSRVLLRYFKHGLPVDGSDPRLRVVLGDQDPKNSMSRSNIQYAART